jgi:hypothetical protein
MRLALAVGITCAVVAAGETVTFHKDVLPVLQARCQECHRTGRDRPMSLMSYAEARPWAKSIKAAVVSKKMPPWFADPATGHFQNDRSLSKKEITLLRGPTTELRRVMQKMRRGRERSPKAGTSASRT